MFGFIKRRLSRTILFALALSAAVFTTAIIYLVDVHQTEDMINEMLISSEDIAHTIYAGIKYPMTIGDKERVERELLDIKGVSKDLEIFICDTDKNIIYATEANTINSKISAHVSSSPFLRTLDSSLKTGHDPNRAFEDESGGTRRIVTIYPLVNHKECNHCHGSSRKVLGAMVVKKTAEENYAAIANLRNYNIVISVMGIAALTMLMYFILSKLVKQPLVEFTDKIDDLTAKIPEGDYSTRINIKRPDEIGALINSFNHLAETLEQKNNALQKAHAELAGANKELEAFAYSVSHDLRAPLRGIDGFSRIILDEYSKDFDANCIRYFKRIRDNTTRMSSLIDDMLTLSRAGRSELLLRPIRLNDIVENALGDFKDDINLLKISVKVGNLPTIHCDPVLMQTAFSNLLSNAVKFMRNKENPEIIIGYDPEKDFIFVKDNGIGFDMQYHDKIFGVFQRLHLPEEYEGTGIGLAIVKKIIERHYGIVWAESKPREGATFFIKFV